MRKAVRLLCDARATIGESPIPFGDDVLWTDPVSNELLHFAGTFETRRTERSIWSLAKLPTGEVVGATDNAFGLVDGSSWSPGPLATVEPGCRFNDMTVDAQGGLWVGVMHRGVLATRGAIYHAASINSKPRQVCSGLGVPNGMKFSSDGTTLFVVDTLARTLLAYPTTDGALGEPVIVTDFLGIPGKPDGMVLGPDDSFHIAMWGGGSVVHIGADGATIGLSEIPAPHVSSLCFTAPGRLAVTTSRMRLSADALARSPSSGGLFEIELGLTQ